MNEVVRHEAAVSINLMHGISASGAENKAGDKSVLERSQSRESMKEFFGLTQTQAFASASRHKKSENSLSTMNRSQQLRLSSSRHSRRSLNSLNSLRSIMSESKDTSEHLNGDASDVSTRVNAVFDLSKYTEPQQPLQPTLSSEVTRTKTARLRTFPRTSSRRSLNGSSRSLRLDSILGDESSNRDERSLSSIQTAKTVSSSRTDASVTNNHHQRKIHKNNTNASNERRCRRKSASHDGWVTLLNPNDKPPKIDLQGFRQVMLKPLTLACGTVVKDGLGTTNFLEALRYEKQVTKSNVAIVFAIRRIGCGSCREHAKQLSLLSTELDCCLIGVVKTSDTEHARLNDFQKKYFQFPIYEDEQQQIFQCFGDRKICALHYVSNRATIEKHYQAKEILHVPGVGSLTQGGILILDGDSHVRNAFHELCGVPLDISELRDAVTAALHPIADTTNKRSRRGGHCDIGSRQTTLNFSKVGISKISCFQDSARSIISAESEISVESYMHDSRRNDDEDYDENDDNDDDDDDKYDEGYGNNDTDDDDCSISLADLQIPVIPERKSVSHKNTLHASTGHLSLRRLKSEIFNMGKIMG